MTDIKKYLKAGINKPESISDILNLFLNRGNFGFGAVFGKEKSTIYSLVEHINFDSKEEDEVDFIPPEDNVINIYISNTPDDSCWFSAPYDIKNIIIIPLTISNDVMGVVCLGNRNTNIEKEIISNLGDLVGLLQIVIDKYNFIQDYKKVYSDSTYFSKDLFLANMSHEIRTPLNGVIGYNQLLMKTRLDETQKSYLLCMSQCGLQLMQIINDILDFSKLASGKMPVNKQCFSVKEIIDILNNTMKERINNKKQTCKYTISKTVPDFIVTDKQKFTQIIMNLLSNAVKFTDINGRIEISIKNFKNTLTVSVKDNGIGISETDQYKLFNSFTQFNNSLTKSGTGLGLAICKRLVDLLGGTISVTSCLGAGSVFSFTCRHYPYKQFEKSIQKNAKILRKKFVLVVDDNPDNRMLLSEMLFEWKMKPIVCASGIEALKLILDNRYDFDLALIDICMPGMSGIQLAEKIKKDRPLFPLIALSCLDSLVNYSDFESKLDKPINKIHLFNAIYNIISQNLYKSVYIGEKSESDSDDNISSPSKSNSPSSDFDKRIKILIAEDICYNQTLLMDMLGTLDYKNVTLARDGLETIQIIDKSYENGDTFDILLLDLRMPKMDGYEVITYMKEKKYTLPKIIIISASILEEDRKRCKLYGVKYFISKPIQLTELKYSLLKASSSCENL